MLFLLETSCEVADRCGGCPRIGHARARQRADKQRQTLALLEQAGVLAPQPSWVSVASPDGYRNRIRLRLDDGRPTFFNPNKSHRCAVLEPGLRLALQEFLTWAAVHRALLVDFAHAELRTADLEGRAGLVLTPRVPAAPGKAAASLPEAPPGFVTWVTGSGPPPFQRVTICDDVFTYLPLGSFRQVNTVLNTALVSVLRAHVRELGCRSFADTFAGSGNLSLPLLVDGLAGAGVEIDAAAIRGLRAAAVEQGCDGSRFEAADAGRWLSTTEADWDLLLLDPPRAGLKGTLAGLRGDGASRIVMWSCGAASFARDMRGLREMGYRLEQLWLADMFPHTDHWEMMGSLVRCESH